MNLSKEPFSIDFIGNRPVWLVKTSPYITPGRKQSVTFAVASLVSDQQIWLRTPHGDFQWTVEQVDYPDNLMSMPAAATLDEVLAALERKLQYRYDVNEHYTISLVKGQSHVAVKVTARDEGTSGQIVLSHDTTPYSVLQSVSGLARSSKDGYKIAARLQYERPAVHGFTPWFYFDDADGRVSIPSDILEPCFSKREIPGFNENVGCYPCYSLLLRARLLFAEFYDGYMHAVKISHWRKFVHGKIGQYEAENNIPDWESVDYEKFYRKIDIDIFGQDNNALVKTDVDTEQYMYVSNFTDHSVGPVDLTVQAVHTTGSVNSTAASLTFESGTVNRIPVGAMALGLNLSTILHYTVSVGNIIRRSFLVVPRNYYARTLLLVNRVGLYESFVIDNVAVEHESSGERTRVANLDAYVVEAAFTTITARTGKRSQGELDILKSAATTDGNLLLDGQYAWRIAIKPDTIKIVDESEDLLEAQFSFLAMEKIDRNLITITAVDRTTVVRMNDNIINTTER